MKLPRRREAMRGALPPDWQPEVGCQIWNLLLSRAVVQATVIGTTPSSEDLINLVMEMMLQPDTGARIRGMPYGAGMVVRRFDDALRRWRADPRKRMEILTFPWDVAALSG